MWTQSSVAGAIVINEMQCQLRLQEFHETHLTIGLPDTHTDGLTHRACYQVPKLTCNKHPTIPEYQMHWLLIC